MEPLSGIPSWQKNKVILVKEYERFLGTKEARTSIAGKKEVRLSEFLRIWGQDANTRLNKLLNVSEENREKLMNNHELLSTLKTLSDTLYGDISSITFQWVFKAGVTAFKEDEVQLHRDLLRKREELRALIHHLQQSVQEKT